MCDLAGLSEMEEKMSTCRMIPIALALFFLCVGASGAVIGFEDLTTRQNFNDLGIANTYQGYEWGYGFGPGLGSRTFVDSSQGWASATVTDTASGPAPAGIGGTSYAWNWNGPQSLWIDFRSPTDVASINFAFLSSTYGSNAATIRLFGYNSTDVLVATSSILTLTDTFQTLTANFSGINYLEIRANENAWFSVDDIVTGQGSVVIPEPASVALLGLGLALIGWARRRAGTKNTP